MGDQILSSTLLRNITQSWELYPIIFMDPTLLN
jgi:hypothetical protein